MATDTQPQETAALTDEREEQQEQAATTAITQPKTPIEMGNRGIALATFEDLWRLSMCIVQGGFAPKGYDTAQAVAIAIQMGAELGLPPMAALQNIAVINGRPSIWGDAMLAVCIASGKFNHDVFSEVVETDDKGMPTRAEVTVGRIGGRPITVEWTWDDVKRADLAGKKGPWSDYPKRMIKLRARSWALRDAFPDVLRGIQTVEEVRDIDENALEVTSREVAPVTQTIEETKAAVSKSDELAAQMGQTTDAETSKPKRAKKATKAEKPAEPAGEPELLDWQKGYLAALKAATQKPQLDDARGAALDQNGAGKWRDWINARYQEAVNRLKSGGQGQLDMQ